MKKKFLFLMALLAASLFVMAEMRVYVYKKDGTKALYVASIVDSIGFVDVNNSVDGHEWVDLGLPSGTKWATCNVGADFPEDYGDYFAWGETTTKYSFTSSNYKYSTSNPTTLPLDRDAAYNNWGTSWRMPTNAEFSELVDNCTWTWITQNGVEGYKATSKINGNSIFLPVAGYRYGSDWSNAGFGGDYWSSSRYTGNSDEAYYCLFFPNIPGRSSYTYRSIGQSVRPVLREIFTLGFDANGGSGSMSAVELERNESKNIPANTFTRHGYRFIGWNTKADGTGTAYADKVSVTLVANQTLYAQWAEIMYADGHEWVDLGLPSGMKWAACNVGADSPEDYGDYFAWGETTTKSYYTSSGYNYSSNPTTLPLDRDAAYTNWGTSWRMPTDAELKELKDNCTWTWITQNGVKGYKVTSKTNDNSIFLPAAGYRSSSDLIDAGSRGDYWSSSPSTSDACILYFGSGGVSSSSSDRYFGRPVRPVLRE